ncbi:hypothetical protein CQW23_05541 [Capsicum baccatum]|uniref:Single-stranded DNA binding protein Ssb-like OB fold domain-containing protein n=1 Tax=Capsicum baccatum TaxID=33114 RepID=A0A2G2XHU5_CAPBA|nr:hypothetical protein CQW23_05541 [Capsicum baccatum]
MGGASAISLHTNMNGVRVRVYRISNGFNSGDKINGDGDGNNFREEEASVCESGNTKPGTHGHNLTVKVVESNPVKATGGGGGRGGRLLVNSRPPAECLIGDETTSILFTTRNKQGK